MNKIRTDSPLHEPEVYDVVARTVMAMAGDSAQGNLIHVSQLVDPEACAVHMGFFGQ